MKPGTPGFSGDRLKEARDARGITGVTLADLLGVSRQAISNYEKGLKTPSPVVMEKIEQVLNLPTQFFIRSPRTSASRVLFYRSMASTTKQARVRAECLYDWLHDIVVFLEQYIRFPEVRFPHLDVPDDPREIPMEMVEETAAMVRRFWGLGDGPISNVVWLLENNGVTVTRYELGAATLDAFSEWFGESGRPYVVLGADKRSASRSRFDAAHELGHLVLHRRVSQRELNTKEIFKLIEDQANRFAGAFLLPASTFSNDMLVPQLDMMRALKTKWGASIALQIHRIADLGIVTKDEARRLWVNRARRGWVVSEPLDDKLPPEEPRFLKRCFELLLKEGLISRDQISQELAIGLSDIEALAAIPRGFLSDNEPDESEPMILKLHRP